MEQTVSHSHSVDNDDVIRYSTMYIPEKKRKGKLEYDRITYDSAPWCIRLNFLFIILNRIELDRRNSRNTHHHHINNSVISLNGSITLNYTTFCCSVSL